MRNVKVGSLSTLLKETAGPLWVKTVRGVNRVKTIREASFFSTDEPDIKLVATTNVCVGEFEDQRVKMDTDKMSIDVLDIRGEVRTLIFGACVPS